MFSSPDLLAFTKEVDERDAISDSCPLPEELSVPLFPHPRDATPWSRAHNAAFDRDFILMSEFSERVGPQPLFTVPAASIACGTFDLNNFSLRIMSVDYQASFAEPGGCAYPRLNFVEDSKVVLGDSKDGVFAYVHHLTLYDLEARGFVRPLCLAYVSSDEQKVMQQFPRLSTEFSKASEFLKTGNRKNFAKDLERKLRKLQYTRSVLLKGLEEERGKDRWVRDREGLEETGKYFTAVKQHEEEQGDGVQLLTERREENVKESLGMWRQTEAEIRETSPGLDEKGNKLNDLHRHAEEEGKMDRSNRSIPREEDERNGGKERKQCDGCILATGGDLACVEKTIQEHKSLLQQITSYPNRKLRDPEFLPYEPDESPCSPPPDMDHLSTAWQIHGLPLDSTSKHGSSNSHSGSPQMTCSSAMKSFDTELKPVGELCDEYFYEQALDQLRWVERSFRGDACHHLGRQQCQHLLLHLRATNFLFESQNDLEEETGAYYGGEGTQHSRYSVPHPLPLLVSEPDSLESYASCVEMVPIKLRASRTSQSVTCPGSVPVSPCNDPTVTFELPQESGSENDDLASTMMAGSLSSGESIEVLGTERSFRTQGSLVGLELMPLRSFHPPLISLAIEGFRRKASTRRMNSEDSIEVLSTTDSIIPEDLRACCSSTILEESPEQDPEKTDPGAPARILCQEEETAQQPTGLMGNVVPGEHGGLLTIEQKFGCPAKDDVGSVIGTPPVTQVNHVSDGVDIPGGSRVPGRPRFASWGDGGSLVEDPFLTGWEDASDCNSYISTSISTTSDSTLPASLHGDGPRVRRRRGSAGRAALRFLKKFPFAAHAVYSLLTGRTLVVLGNEENSVRRLVLALSLYLPHPGRDEEHVKPWTSTPLQLSDLLNWKLVGLNRTCSPTSLSVPHCLVRYARYLSVLDVDQKSLRCPAYRGSLIGLLVEPRTHIRRGSTYFLLAQSVLGKFASQAFLMTFSHTLCSPGEIEDPKQRASAERFRGALKEGDEKLLLFLCEVIRQRFTGAPPTQLRLSYSASTLFKL